MTASKPPPGKAHKRQTAASGSLSAPMPVAGVHLPLVILGVTAVLGLAVAFLLWYSYRADEGHLVFSLDDPYIQLSMARTLSSHGIWGVSPSAFSATSSAPLYTLLLALAFLLGGASEFWAWLFAIAGGLAAAALLAHRISRYFGHPAAATAIGVWAVVLVGLPEAMFTGMEHTLHTVVVLLIAAVATSTGEGPRRWVRSDLLLCVLVLIGAGLRYETLFLVPVLSGYLLWRGRCWTAFTVVIAATLPAIVLGVVQLANGQMFLPNTLMLKGVIGYNHRLSYFSRFLYQIDSQYFAFLFALVVVGAFFSFWQRSHPQWKQRLMLAGLFVSGCLLQVTFAQTERRYVTYLVALGIWAAVPWVAEWVAKARTMMQSQGFTRKRTRLFLGWAMVLCLGVFPFADRLIDLQRLWRLGQDVYAQQYQVARFFSTAYAGQAVALNDIGTTCWFNRNQVVDLWGLADGNVARLRMADDWHTDSMGKHVARAGASVAAVYPIWFAKSAELPPGWRPVGGLQLPRRIQMNAASPQVVFYATSEAAARLLRTRLAEFASELPSTAVYTPFF